MAALNSTTPSPTCGGGAFATTHWSLILSAAREDQPDSLQALETLCQIYWRPLHAFVRRSGYSPADADDLTQAFFAHLIGSGLVKKVQVEGGKFRSFLVVSLKNFLASERERAHAQKRGGGRPALPIEACGIEIEDSSDSPDLAFDKAWAVTVLQEAMDLLAREHHAAGREAVFEQLRIFLTGEKSALPYSVVAERLGTSEGAVKMMVQRMRRRYRECLHAVVLRTVARADQVDDELRHLREALG